MILPEVNFQVLHRPPLKTSEYNAIPIKLVIYASFTIGTYFIGIAGLNSSEFRKTIDAVLFLAITHTAQDYPEERKDTSSCYL